MKIFATLMSVVLLTGLGGSPESAYLVARATVVPDDAKQPTWIGLWRQIESRRGELIHVPADGVVTEIPPGVYQIAHIDFGSQKSGRGTQHLNEVRFKVLSGKVYFLGHFELLRRSKGKYKLENGDGLKLLEKACHDAPEVLDKFPIVTMKDTEDEILQPCQTFSEQSSRANGLDGTRLGRVVVAPNKALQRTLDPATFFAAAKNAAASSAAELWR